jgi:epsilon-lactone hydrolase
MPRMVRVAVCACLLSAGLMMAQEGAREATTASEAPQRDTSYIDANGTAHVTRVMPVPQDLSPEAQKFISRRLPDAVPPESLAVRRSRTDQWLEHSREEWTKLCPNTIEDTTMAGVPVRVVTPANITAVNRDKVLVNLHGGGFNSDSGSYAETIPIAGYTGIRVVAVLYRLAPEHPFPAGLDDAVAVYRELLKTYKPEHIVIYGTSAGATITAEMAVKLKQMGLPMPAALGIFSSLDSFARVGDSYAMYSLDGLSGPWAPPTGTHDPYYVGTTDAKDPVLSPIYGDPHGFPPTLFVSSERDALLSSTANLDRAYLRAGVDARFVVFDALPHAFWYQAQMPEAIEANHMMAKFFLEQLGAGSRVPGGSR